MKLAAILTFLILLTSCRDIDNNPEPFEGNGSNASSQAAVPSKPISNPPTNKSDDLDTTVTAPKDEFEAVPGELQEAFLAFSSCTDVQAKLKNAKSGIYKVFLKGADETINLYDAYCDLESEGGGWMLVTNYVHKAATNPPLKILKNAFPLLGPGKLGDDEQNTQYFGHLAPAFLKNFEAKELRFFCQTSNVNRVIHFRTLDPVCVDYGKTGVGNCHGVRDNFTMLTGHTGRLPAAQSTSGSINDGDLALSKVPFRSTDQLNHWSINNNGQWECDDDPDNANFNTIHRIWVR